MNELTIFEFNGNKGRIFIDETGEPWFVAKDVAEALGYTSTNMTTIFSTVPGEWKGSNPIATPSGEQEMLCVSEAGLFFFLGRSDKKAALPYQKKVAGEVMPSIRKHGAYLTDAKIEEVLTSPDTIIRLATDLKAEREKRLQLETQAEADRPKLVFANSVESSQTSILIGDLAKIMRQNGVDMGQNRLFAKLREDGFLMKAGDSRNMPTQKGMELGLFEIIERTVNCPDGSIRITRTTKVTGKGQIYFINLFSAT